MTVGFPGGHRAKVSRPGRRTWRSTDRNHHQGPWPAHHRRAAPEQHPLNRQQGRLEDPSNAKRSRTEPASPGALRPKAWTGSDERARGPEPDIMAFCPPHRAHRANLYNKDWLSVEDRGLRKPGAGPDPPLARTRAEVIIENSLNRSSSRPQRRSRPEGGIPLSGPLCIRPRKRASGFPLDPGAFFANKGTQAGRVGPIAFSRRIPCPIASATWPSSAPTAPANPPSSTGSWARRCPSSRPNPRPPATA